MTRFAAIDYSRLPPPPKTAASFETTYAAYMADLTARLNAVGIPYDVGMLETDTYAITGEAFSYRATLVAQQIDDAISAVLLPTSWGAFLDNLGAGQSPSVQRKPLTAGARPYVDYPEDWEKDEDFKARIQFAPEALSTCGPEGAYAWFALEVEGTAAVGVYGPMSFSGTPAAPFTPLGEVHIPIISEVGDGTADAALVAATQAAVSADERRPIADFVTVSAATILPYTLDVALQVGSGADPGTVLTQGYARLRALADYVHRPGGAMRSKEIYVATYVPGPDGRPVVGDVDLGAFIDVNGTRITADNPGPAYIAPFCPKPIGDPVITTEGELLVLTAGGIRMTLEVVDD